MHVVSAGAQRISIIHYVTSLAATGRQDQCANHQYGANQLSRSVFGGLAFRSGWEYTDWN